MDKEKEAYKLSEEDLEAVTGGITAGRPTNITADYGSDISDDTSGFLPFGETDVTTGALKKKQRRAQ